jgi:hypothetical protein
LAKGGYDQDTLNQTRPAKFCKIQKWLFGQSLAELIRYQLEFRDSQRRLQFDLDSSAFTKLIDHRLGRTVLLTNRRDETTEQVVAGYAGQQQVERVFHV